MFLMTAARGGVAAARAVVRLAASAGNHVGWWVDHNLGGSARNTHDGGESSTGRE